MHSPTSSARSLLASLLLVTVVGCSAGDLAAPTPRSGPSVPPPPPAPVPLTGNLQVQVVPTFEPLSVGVSVTVEGQGFIVSKSSSAFLLSGLAPGSYRIEVALIEGATRRRGSDCSIQEANPRTASVIAGTTTTVVFGVYCRGWTPNVIPARAELAESAAGGHRWLERLSPSRDFFSASATISPPR